VDEYQVPDIELVWTNDSVPIDLQNKCLYGWLTEFFLPGTTEDSMYTNVAFVKNMEGNTLATLHSDYTTPKDSTGFDLHYHADSLLSMGLLGNGSWRVLMDENFNYQGKREAKIHFYHKWNDPMGNVYEVVPVDLLLPMDSNAFQAWIDDPNLLDFGTTPLLDLGMFHRYYRGGGSPITFRETRIEVYKNDSLIGNYRSDEYFSPRSAMAALVDSTTFGSRSIRIGHWNAAWVDEDSLNIMMSDRNRGTFYRMDLLTGQIEADFRTDWINPSNSYPSGQHDVHLFTEANRTFLSCFDNRNAEAHLKSRLLVYELRGDTADLHLEWYHPDSLFGSFMGGAQRLIEGYWLITWGSARVNDSNLPIATLIDDAGNIVCEFLSSVPLVYAYRFSFEEPMRGLVDKQPRFQARYWGGNEYLVEVVSGGDSIFQWSNTDSLFYSVGDTLSNGLTVDTLLLEEGSYKVRAQLGGLGWYMETEVAVVPADSLVAYAYPWLPTCHDGQDGGIRLAVQGGTPPYQFLWSNGYTTQNINGVGAGMYSVVVTDSVGDTFGLSATVENPIALDSLIHPMITHPSCVGLNDGSISISMLDTTRTYTYSWSNGSTNPHIANLSEGVYDLTVTDQAGCMASLSLTIQEPLPPPYTVNITNVSCVGETDGAISLTIANSNYMLSWSNGSSGSHLTDLAAETYLFIALDPINGCFFVDSVAVGSPDSLIVEGVVNQHASCAGCGDGIGAAAVRGGTPPYSYSWANGDSVNALSGLGVGSYMVWVTDANGCEVTATITIDSTGIDECGRDVFEPNDTEALASPLPEIGILANAQICPAGDIDWYTFEVNSTKPNIALSLTGLEADFDIRIYNATGSLVGQALGLGNADEVLHLNGLLPDTYYIEVRGKDSAFHYTDGYYLNINAHALPFNIPNREADNVSLLSEIREAGRWKIRLEGLAAGTSADLVIHSALGQKLMEVKGLPEVNGQVSYEAEIAHWPEGVYMLSVYTETTKKTTKLCIIR